MPLAAARNNADWCAAMCRAHDLPPGTFGDRAWTSAVRTPPYYPDAVTLHPDATADDVLGGIDLRTPGASVKDSFAALDLTPHGFRILFEAHWIHRPAGPPASGADEVMEPVRTPAGLAAWQQAWSGGDQAPDLFRPALLADPSTTVLAGGVHRATGAVLTLAAGAVGVSNLFGPPDAAWPACLAAAHRLHPGTPVVGYDSGDDLTAALRHGFTATGPLRIWLAVS